MKMDRTAAAHEYAAEASKDGIARYVVSVYGSDWLRRVITTQQHKRSKATVDAVYINGKRLQQ